MWIFTKHGFFSAVCARQGDGKHGQPVDPDRIMVRAGSGPSRSPEESDFPTFSVSAKFKSLPGPITPTGYSWRSLHGRRWLRDWQRKPTTTTSSRRSPAIREVREQPTSIRSTRSGR